MSGDLQALDVKANPHVSDRSLLSSQVPAQCLLFTDETMMTIHFNANLRSVVGNQVGMLYWIMNPEASGFVIGYDLDGNQVLICNLDV